MGRRNKNRRPQHAQALEYAKQYVNFNNGLRAHGLDPETVATTKLHRERIANLRGRRTKPVKMVDVWGSQTPMRANHRHAGGGIPDEIKFAKRERRK